MSELGPYRLLVEEAHDLISAHSTDINAVFTFASGGFDRLLGMDPSVRRCFDRSSVNNFLDVLVFVQLSSFVRFFFFFFFGGGGGFLSVFLAGFFFFSPFCQIPDCQDILLLWSTLHEKCVFISIT